MSTYVVLIDDRLISITLQMNLCKLRQFVRNYLTKESQQNRCANWPYNDRQLDQERYTSHR
jgi:hypothetical protein